MGGSEAFECVCCYDASAYGLGVIEGEVTGTVDGEDLTIESVLYDGTDVMSYLPDEIMTIVMDLTLEAVNG